MRRLICRWICVLPLVALVACGRKPDGPRAGGAGGGVGGLVKSADCASCHEGVTKVWAGSHHALAHRDMGGVEDAWAFVDRQLDLAEAQWQFGGGEKSPVIRWKDSGVGGDGLALAPVMAIGHRPLIQYVLDFGKGRYQVPDASWDPVKQEWFSMFGADQRRPHEWGHWTQRGMNWNSQCAYCHFTGFEKNYQAADDGYQTTWVEQGVGCAQCHGPAREARAGNECVVDPQQKFTVRQWTHSCATCHGRREEFDESFVIGDDFYDHYNLALPSQPGLYHPDGQQIDEDYNFTSLLLSRMGHKGIGCIDCHDAHGAEPKGGRAAVESGALCMQCHGSGMKEAKMIDPATHTFHKPGTPGGKCVDCHMPKKAYMARDPRSDHRFPSPDPLLTKELGVPNACNDCHADKGLDWQIEWTEKWYGEWNKPMDRERTRAMVAAQKGDAGALERLLAVFDREEIAAWQATLLREMMPWLGDTRVAERAVRAARHEDPLVRTAAAAVLAREPEPGPVWAELARDPVRSVRLEAGWGAVARVKVDEPLFAEMERVARHQSDQPGGRMRLAQLAVLKGDRAAAEEHMRTAAAWDQGSSTALRDLAVFLAEGGKARESLKALDEAAKRAPEDPELPYLSALGMAELGDARGAEGKLREAIRINPRFGRAHYNLGLLLSGQGQDSAAIIALRNAANLSPGDPGPSYALATIYLRLKQIDAAETAAREALRRDPGYQPASALLQSIGR